MSKQSIVAAHTQPKTTGEFIYWLMCRLDVLEHEVKMLQAKIDEINSKEQKQ